MYPQKLVQYPRNHLEGVVPPILALLKPALNDKALITVACKAWLRMAQCLTKESLGQYLASMVVSLLSVFPSSDDAEASTESIKLDLSVPADEALLLEVHAVLNYLLQDRLEDVREFLKDIPCLPRCRLLEDIERVSAACAACSCSRCVTCVPSGCFGRVSWFEHCCQPDSTDTIAASRHSSSEAHGIGSNRKTAVLKQQQGNFVLRVTICSCWDNRMSISCRSKLHLMQVLQAFYDSSRDKLKDVVTELVSALLDVTNKSRERGLWLRVARCLGQIGAIDPSRVNLTVSVHQVR